MTRPRPTRRGWAAVAVVVTGTLVAYHSGPRALGAVVLPTLVALGAAVVQVRRAPAPDVTRVCPADGSVGEVGTVTLQFDAAEPFPATVDDRTSPGLDRLDGPTTAVVGADPVRYRVEYAARGRQSVGPVVVRTTDVLGLVARSRTHGGTDHLLVHPPVRELRGSVRHRLGTAVDDPDRSDRDEFDGLREYVRGDPLRDLNWKASAKRDALVVTEYAGARPETSVAVAAGADADGADAMATAAASLVVALCRSGVGVDLHTPDGRVRVGPEDATAALDHLAVVGPGPVPAGPAADVVVDARDGETRVRAGDLDATFDSLREGRLGADEEVTA